VVHRALQAGQDRGVQAGRLVRVPLGAQDVVVAADGRLACARMCGGCCARVCCCCCCCACVRVCVCVCVCGRCCLRKRVCLPRSPTEHEPAPAAAAWRCRLRTTNRCGSCVSASANSVVSAGICLRTRSRGACRSSGAGLQQLPACFAANGCSSAARPAACRSRACNAPMHTQQHTPPCPHTSGVSHSRGPAPAAAPRSCCWRRRNTG
jgi:hypothetical protein